MSHRRVMNISNEKLDDSIEINDVISSFVLLIAMKSTDGCFAQLFMDACWHSTAHSGISRK